MPFHLVSYSPWPLLASAGAMFLLSGLGAWFHGQSPALMYIGLLTVLSVSFNWWRDVTSESTYSGYHTSSVTHGLRLGMLLFILSEVCFFFAFFWAFFHSSLSPTPALGGVWPPSGVHPLSATGVPLLNTVILLSSGVTITWCHHSLTSGDTPSAVKSLWITCNLGGYFTYLQATEYLETSFSITDSVFGSCFFVATGFHGLHVLIGTTALLVCLQRLRNIHFSSSHHVGFEASCWYWHFVDVVWLFLFMTIYLWGS
uniref:Cytochrome c oxidase subunit 3 n=1 Tax=Flustrellidra hispida TaxID=97271 RepID=Q15K56_9BILA|nr:cytochrome c oxidase subunit III [Flustrellidra hispida]AAZ76746.1 cytochrome c oxidase subunit III [Flustrellidra hispida]